MQIRSKRQALTVNWHRELYTVSEGTLEIADSRRICWICKGPFKVGDGMTVVNTEAGNKPLHTACFQEQVDKAEGDA